MGNPTDISQALMNLCTNGRNAVPDGGRLVVKVVPEGRRAKVTVFDTGEGMNQEAVENLGSEAEAVMEDYIPKPIGL